MMALSALLAVAAGPSQAETGTVHVRVVNMGFILSAGGGEGVLTYRGKGYPFTVSGIGVGVIGAAAAELRGRAYNLRRPSDIAGTYSVIGAGAAVVGGVRATRLQNANGVVLALQGGQVGLQLSAGMSGVTIAMR
jgi:hypothetical protein